MIWWADKPDGQRGRVQREASRRGVAAGGGREAWEICMGSRGGRRRGSVWSRGEVQRPAKITPSRTPQWGGAANIATGARLNPGNIHGWPAGPRPAATGSSAPVDACPGPICVPIRARGARQ
jgi:hypothetical protein